MALANSGFKAPSSFKFPIDVSFWGFFEPFDSFFLFCNSITLKAKEKEGLGLCCFEVFLFMVLFVTLLDFGFCGSCVLVCGFV